MRAAILGAGIAGLNLARRLAQGGLDVQLFEKARGPAGRLSTRRSEAGQFDHGAQYLTARDPGFRAQVEEWSAHGVIAPWTGRIVRLAGGEIRPDESRSERFVGRPRMSALARSMLGDLPIELGVRIESAERGPEGWTLRSEAGQEYGGFGALLLAVPAPQAVPFLGAVPDTRSRVEAVGMWPCHAGMVRFRRPLDAGFEGAFVDEPELSWVALDSSKPGRSTPGPGQPADGLGACWVLHSQAEWSGAHVDLDAQGVLDALLAAFARALGRPLPEQEFSSVHRWLYARTAKPLGVDAIWHEDDGIGICGDWLRGDRVEDGYLSGEALAARVLASPGRR